jgi:tetratricopeptide (TPR) repeat protein
MRSRPLLIGLTAIGGLALFILIAAFIYNIPAVNDRLYPRVDRFMNDVRNWMNPAPEVVPTSAPLSNPPTFIPDIPNTPTATLRPSPTATLAPEQPTSTPAPTDIPLVVDLPNSVSLKGSRYEPQLYNNCGPATLTALLVYWGWRGSEPDDLTYTFEKNIRWQRDIADVIKPGQSDKNVMPYELTNFAEDHAGLRTLIRYGGNIDIIRNLVANEIPVIIERGFQEDEHGQVGQGWEGHYSLVTGYNDSTRQLLTQDSYIGPNYLLNYDHVTARWRDFNYIYIVMYPPEREAAVLSILELDADAGANLNRALVKSQNDAELHSNDSKELAFDWFNIGTNLQLLGRNEDAALAFDQARSFGTLPYRMLWYQTVMYRAYFYAGQYQPIIDLATVTLQTNGLEESYYWRAWAYHENGNTDGAINDMRSALAEHPGWDQAIAALTEWGATP